MNAALKFVLFPSLMLILFVTYFVLQNYVHDPDENTRAFIRDENNEMKKFLEDKMFAQMSKTFGEQLQRSESKMTAELGSLNETLQVDHKQLSQSISSFTKALFPPPTLTEVEEVNEEEGTIEFTGGTNPHLRTKIWILQSKGGTSYRLMSFMMEEIRLGEDARLSLWGSHYAYGSQKLWNESLADWSEERTNKGNVILLTLSVSPGGAKTASFKLKFNATGTYGDWVSSSAVLKGRGRQVVSFPPNNTGNYPPDGSFVAVVAPAPGVGVGFTSKYLDIPGTHPHNCDARFYVWFLEETSTGLPFTRLPSSAYRGCGRVGNISEPLGNSTVAILHFSNNGGTVGKGFRVEVN